MSRRLQFSLKALMAATLLAGIGLALLLQADNVTIWEFSFLVSAAWMTFGAAVGVMAGKPRKWTIYGAAMGMLVALLAFYGEELGAFLDRLPLPLRGAVYSLLGWR